MPQKRVEEQPKETAVPYRKKQEALSSFWSTATGWAPATNVETADLLLFVIEYAKCTRVHRIFARAPTSHGLSLTDSLTYLRQGPAAWRLQT